MAIGVNRVEYRLSRQIEVRKRRLPDLIFANPRIFLRIDPPKIDLSIINSARQQPHDVTSEQELPYATSAHFFILG